MEIVIIIVTNVFMLMISVDHHEKPVRWVFPSTLKRKLTVCVELAEGHVATARQSWNLRSSLLTAPLGLSEDFRRADTV